MNMGQSATFNANASGGSGTYASYQWYVDGSAQSGQSEPTFTFTPASTGTYSITATVTDSSGTTSTQSTAVVVTVSVTPTPTPSLTPSPTSTPTSTTIPSATPSPTTTNPSPTAPEFPAQLPRITLAASMIIVLSVAITIKKKNRKNPTQSATPKKDLRLNYIL
jgi:PKD repeat protein